MRYVPSSRGLAHRTGWHRHGDERMPNPAGSRSSSPREGASSPGSHVRPALSSRSSVIVAGSGTAAAQTDDTTDDAADDGTDDRATERTERVRALLQDLVDDGTITAEQADSVAAHLVENAPDRGPRHRLGRRIVASEVITDLLGIDAQTLLSELRDGSTLAEIAEANGVDVTTLVDALVAEATERVDRAVEAGRIAEATAADKLADLEERITDRVNGERSED